MVTILWMFRFRVLARTFPAYPGLFSRSPILSFVILNGPCRQEHAFLLSQTEFLHWIRLIQMRTHSPLMGKPLLDGEVTYSYLEPVFPQSTADGFDIVYSYAILLVCVLRCYF